MKLIPWLSCLYLTTERFVESTPGSMMDSPESLVSKEEMGTILDGRESPDVPSSTSDSRDTIEVVNHDDGDLKSEEGSCSPGKRSPNSHHPRSGGGGSTEKSTPKNPLLIERCNCEELRHGKYLLLPFVSLYEVDQYKCSKTINLFQF